MNIRSISVSGIRGNKNPQIIGSYERLTPKSVRKIEDKIIDLIYNNKIEEIILGGAMGSDNIALAYALAHRNRPLEDYDSIINPLKITVILPYTIEKQPEECWDLIRQADEIIEIKYRALLQAYFVRNSVMVQRADKLVAFWDGESRGTRMTIKIAEKLKKDIEIIWVEASE